MPRFRAIEPGSRTVLTWSLLLLASLLPCQRAGAESGPLSPKVRIAPAARQHAPKQAASQDVFELLSARAAAPAGLRVSAESPVPVEDKPLSSLQFRLAPKGGELPEDVARARLGDSPGVLDGSLATRRPVEMIYAWEAPALCYGPIYIQDVNLERYGYSHGIFQAGFSAVHFFGSVAILPYLVGAYPQRECYYTLGYYRPGSGAPYQKSLPRLSLRGVLFEGGVGTAAAFGVPGFIP